MAGYQGLYSNWCDKYVISADCPSTTDSKPSTVGKSRKEEVDEEEEWKLRSVTNAE